MNTCNDCKWSAECIGAVPDGKWSACPQFEGKEMKGLEAWEIISANMAELYRIRKTLDPQCKGYSSTEITAEVVCFEALRRMDETKEE